MGSVGAIPPNLATRDELGRVLSSRCVLTWKDIVGEASNVTGRKAKSRFCVGGHRDPDLEIGLRTDASGANVTTRNLVSPQPPWGGQRTDREIDMGGTKLWVHLVASRRLCPERDMWSVGCATFEVGDVFQYYGDERLDLLLADEQSVDASRTWRIDLTRRRPRRQCCPERGLLSTRQ